MIMDTHERALNDAHNFRTAGELAQLAGEAVITRDPDAAELAGLAATAYTQDRPELDADMAREDRAGIRRALGMDAA
jgi:hypothetical protein